MYWILAATWILISDRLLHALVIDRDLLITWSMYKGWGFVTLTAILLYFTVQRLLRSQESELLARREAEIALRESEERFRILVEQASDAFFVHDRDGNVTDVNRAASESLGYTREELLKLKLTDIEQDLDRDKPHTLCADIQPGESSTFYGHQRRKDGSIFPVEVRLSSFDLHGRRLILALVRDITERRQAEAAVKHRLELEERLSALANHVPGMIYALRMHPDGSFSFPFVGASSEEILAIPPAELMANPEGSLRTVHADDLTALRKSIFDSAGALSLWRAEFRVHHPRKGIIWVEGRASPRREPDGSVLWHGYIDDVTDRKHAGEVQARLATAVEQAAEAIIITDPHGSILYVNPSFERITGYAAAEVVGGNPRVLKSGRHDAEFYDKMWESLRAEGTWTGRMVNKRKDGTVYEEEMTISSVLDANGNVVNYVAVKRDVTREIQLEQQLRQSQKMEAIGQLAGGVAHDFNNILTVIQGNVSFLLQPGVDAADVSESARQILAAAERAANLTRQLLLFSRKQVIQPVSLEMNAVVSGMTKMLQRILGEDITLNSEFAPELPPILADAGMIEQVVLNLAVNSRDAMPNGGRLLIATSSRVVEENRASQINGGVSPGEYVCLSVCDSGDGIAPDHLPHIFEPFFTTKEVGKGTGLGLATVHGIVKQHRGWIDVASEAGKGTTFEIWFPAIRSQAATNKDERVSSDMPAGTETILFAEDESSLRALVVTLLKRCGYRVLAAESGVAALALWQEHKGEIQLLLTDLVMPGGLSGISLAEKLHAEKPELRVVYTSGYSTELKKTSRLVEGVNFLQKPYSPAALARIVRGCLDLA